MSQPIKLKLDGQPAQKMNTDGLVERPPTMVWEFTLCENNNAGNNASDIWIENNFISKIFTSGSFLKALIDCNFSALDITEIHSITSY